MLSSWYYGWFRVSFYPVLSVQYYLRVTRWILNEIFNIIIWKRFIGCSKPLVQERSFVQIFNWKFSYSFCRDESILKRFLEGNDFWFLCRRSRESGGHSEFQYEEFHNNISINKINIFAFEKTIYYFNENHWDFRRESGILFWVFVFRIHWSATHY